jgi:GAF domain-containing protein
MLQTERRADDLLSVGISLAIQLSVEEDFTGLLERILAQAKALCNADAGSIYLRTADDQLQFMIMSTTTLGLALGGTTGLPIPYQPLPLYDRQTGAPNDRHVATHVALTGTTVNVPDVYQPTGTFDFSGAQAFDDRTGYHTTSMLTIPLRNGPRQVIGVIQLLNAQDRETGAVIPFDVSLHAYLEGLASFAAIALAAHLREQSLRQEIRQLRIEIDEARREREVAEITGTDRFQLLRERAQARRGRRAGARA